MSDTYPRGYVRIELPDSEIRATLVTASEVRDVLTSKGLYCCWEVTRRGHIEPCGSDAVAIRYDENNGGIGEVCKHHAKRALVPLSFIAFVAKGISS